MGWSRRKKPTPPTADEQWAPVREVIDSARRQRVEATRGREGLVAEISDSLFRADPIGINFVSNTDEYDAEAETIVIALPRAENVEQVRDLTHECFVQWFDAQLAGPAERYDSIAADIWVAWQRHLARD